MDDTGVGYSVLEGSGFEGLAPGILFNDTDPDGDPLTVYDADPGTPGIQPVQAPAHGTLTLNLDGSHSYTHDGSETTTDSFTYRAFDGMDSSNTATVTITVTPTDDAPVAADDGPYSVSELGLISAGVLANDSDAEGDALTAVLVSAPSHAASFELSSSGSFTYRPKAPFAGTDSFTYRAVAGGKQSNIATVTIEVSAALFCGGLHVTILGTPGDDEISGTAGDDVIDGGFGNDQINGRAGNDTICGGDGEDLVVGGPGDDVLSGGDGSDVLRGAEGDDDLRGGAGSDVLLPEAGGGIADGGPGSDLIDFRAMVAPGTADGMVEVDLTAGTAVLTLFGSSGAPDTVYTTEVRRVEKVFGTFEGDDVLTGDGRRNVLKGFGGADVLTGGGDDDDLIGGTEDDVLHGGDGADLLKGQANDDLLTGGPGDDTLRGGTGRDTISGEDGDDFLRAGLRVPSMTVDLDPLDGGPGDDLCVNSPNVTSCERLWPQTLL
jgi:VCBS repeat-containing protein